MRVSDIVAAFARASAEELPGLLEQHATDDRPGVVRARRAAERRLAIRARETERLDALHELQRSLERSGFRVIAGVDEVGRGALAGPVTAAAVVMAADARIDGLDDSKRLTPTARLHVAARVREVARAWAIAHAEPNEIDALGIARATVLAMRRALDALGLDVDHVLVDGLPVDLGCTATAVVKGDSTVACIAAASVLAKVERDAYMVRLDRAYPAYGFAQHKGYGCAAHLDALRRLGPSPMHRLSFAPCAQTNLF